MLRRAIVGAVGAWRVAGLAAVLPLLVTVAASGAPTGAILPTGGECRTLAPDAGFVAEVMTDPASGAVESRVALVIGNGAYSGTIGALPNPVNDATAVAGLLTRLGFTVLLITDATAEAIAACADRLAAEGGHAVGLLYYSGHGIQIDDSNYLVAVDATGTEGLEGFVAVQPLVDALTERAAATLVFLDACRDNPLAADGREGLSVQTGRGLGRVEGTGGADGGPAARHARGLLVGYSTSPNAVALDGDGPYSPFTEAFLEHIGTPGLPVQQVLSEVANSVGEATDWSQTPWTRSSLTSALRLNGRQTLEEAVAASENWANRSKEALARGLREEAIVAALKGLPPDLDDADAETFAEAHLALYTAVRSGDVRLPLPASKRDELLGGMWGAVISPDRSRVVFNVGATSGVVLKVDGVEGPNRIELWGVQAGQQISTLVEHVGNHVAPAFSSDGRMLAVGGKNGEVLLFDPSDGRLIARIPAFTPEPKAAFFSINTIAFGPDSDRLVLSAHGNSAHLKVWSIAERRFITELDPTDFRRPDGVNTTYQNQQFLARFIDDDMLCVAVFQDAGYQSPNSSVMAGIIDLTQNRLEPIGHISGDVYYLGDLACGSDSRAVSIAYSDSDGHQLAIWTSETPPDRPMQLPADKRVFPVGMAFDPTARYLALIYQGSADISQLYDLSSMSARYLDLKRNDWVSKPGAPSGYGDTYSLILNLDGDAISGHLARDRIWAPTPTGRALIELAIGELSPARQAEVAKDRIRWRALDVALNR